MSLLSGTRHGPAQVRELRSRAGQHTEGQCIVDPALGTVLVAPGSSTPPSPHTPRVFVGRDLGVGHQKQGVVLLTRHHESRSRPNPVDKPATLDGTCLEFPDNGEVTPSTFGHRRHHGLCLLVAL